MIQLGMQGGGPKSDRKILTPYTVFNKLLREYCAKSYSPNVLDFIIILRVSGEIADFDFEGCNNLRRNHKKKYISIDIGVPKQVCLEKTENQLREYLTHSVKQALQLFIARLKKDKEPVNEEELFLDYSTLSKIYLSVNE